jgi:hypothetical protein
MEPEPIGMLNFIHQMQNHNGKLLSLSVMPVSLQG